MRSRIFTACSLLLLGGCAYGVDTALQDVRVETPGAYNAWCIADVRGFRYKFNPPETINIRKSPDDMILECVAPGNRRRTVIVPPRDADTSILNVFNGYVPGLAVDHYSGAAYQYPDLILVDFQGIESEPEAMPAQNAPDVIQPEEYDLEEFLPSQPRLNSDRYAVPSQILKRERKTQNFYDTNAFGRVMQPMAVAPDAMNPDGESTGTEGAIPPTEGTAEPSAEQQQLIDMADPSGAESPPAPPPSSEPPSEPVQSTIDPMALDPSSPPPETGTITTVPSQSAPPAAPATPPSGSSSSSESYGPAPQPPSPPPTATPQPVTPPATAMPQPIAPQPAGPDADGPDAGGEAVPAPAPSEPAPFPPREFLEKSGKPQQQGPAAPSRPVPPPVAPAQTNL